MGLFDRLTNRRHLADGTSITKTKRGGSAEIGVSGESVITTFEQGEARTDKLSILDYEKMRANDGTVASLYNILTLPILSNAYNIEADDKDSGEEQAKFIRANLLDPPHRGGMELPLSLILADMLRGVLEGFRLFERVYGVQNGKIVYKKLAPRDAETITLLRDSSGGYGGAHQQTTFQGEWIDVEIPAWKTFLFTFGKDKNFLYGESAFKAAFYHYDIKHKLYYLSNLAIQVAAVPPKIVTRTDETADPNGDRDKKAKAAVLREIDKLGVRTTAYLPKGYELSAFDSARGRLDPLPLIEHHNAEMARSILAQFLMLGTSSKSVGSWALSENQSDIFILALKGLMQNIEDHINFYVIPDLIDLNFATPTYPVFRFDDMTSDTKQIMREAFTKLIEHGSVSEALARGIQERVAENLEIDVDQIQKQLDKEKTKAAEEATKNPPPPGQPDEQPPPPAPPPVQQSDQGQKKHLADSRWFRPLTPAEERVTFAQLDSKLNDLEATFGGKATAILNATKDDAVQRLATLLEKRDLKGLDDFELSSELHDQYVSLIAATMRDSYQFAKRGVADELKVPAPSRVRRDSNTFITEQAAAVADKEFSELLFGIKAEVLKEMRKNTLADQVRLGLSEILAAISGLFATFVEDKLTLTGSIAVSQAVNRARDDVFEASREEIYAYQYSAILDGRVCPICASLDKTTVDYTGYRSTRWVPPIHMRCRCIWVAILKTELDPPPLTPFPVNPGGVSEPAL